MLGLVRVGLGTNELRGAGCASTRRRWACDQPKFMLGLNMLPLEVTILSQEDVMHCPLLQRITERLLLSILLAVQFASL